MSGIMAARAPYLKETIVILRLTIADVEIAGSIVNVEQLAFDGLCLPMA